MGPKAPARIVDVERRYRARPDRPRSYRFSGIAGDVAHSFGYHVDPAALPSGDYSVVTKRDRRGARRSPADASAWDQSYKPKDMITVTRRLLKAAKARDPRMSAVREFCGTLDGRRTFPWDCHSNSSEGINSWDDSHLWHVHASLYRDASEAEVAKIVDVLCGVPLTVPEKIKQVGSKVKQVVVPPRPKWVLPEGHYYGPIKGPDECHGGYHPGERNAVRAIQLALQQAGCAPRDSGWADGKWEKPTTAAMKRWQTSKKRQVTGVCRRQDWKALVR